MAIKHSARRIVGDGELDREVWLADRRSGIGASEASAALGISRWGTPLKLFLQKTGRLEADAENDAMRWGRRLEPMILNDFECMTGRRLRERQVFVQSAEWPHLRATLDAVDEEGGVVEAKLIGERRAEKELGEPGTDQVPDDWVIQAQQQLLCEGVDHVTFAVQVGFVELRQYRVERRPVVLDMMLPRLESFWRCVTTDTPPPPLQPSDAALQALLTPNPVGRIDLSSREIVAAVDVWQMEGLTQKASQERRDVAKMQILAALEDCAEGALPDGRVVCRKLVTVREHTCAESVSVRLSIKYEGR
jgi:putative phage-type endonuclease